MVGFRVPEESLNVASEKLGAVAERRELILKESRAVISLSSKAIVSLQAGRLDDAKKALSEASKMLRRIRKWGGGELQRYMVPPESEFVEAHIVYSVASGKKIPGIGAVGVSPASYVIGLADSVGEIKRMVYDGIRQRKLKRSKELFELMEEIYTKLSPCAVYDHVAPGLRRKIDVARILVEDARGLVTEDSRRSELIKSMKDLSHLMSSKRERD